jgi:phospholipid/cholesterol/gamma-HCH transport system permease protein
VLLQSETSGDALKLHLSGRWCIDNIAQVEASLAGFDGAGRRHIVVDTEKLEGLDLSGAWVLRKRLEDIAGEGGRIEFVGRASVAQFRGAMQSIGFFGRLMMTMMRALTSFHRMRVPSITRHVYETGIQAIPIVSLIAFLISVIIAYLSAQQLRQFGADIFTVDLVAIAVLREMGVLLTAIIVAGRSGSAFAAEIGVMRLNEEVDALESMGVDYFEVLVQPRLIGLIIALPLLTIIADAMGLAGGALLSYLLLGIDLSQFIPRVQDALAPTTFWAGFIKAPVFAMLIAMVGTYRGMQVRESSRELGRLTTQAVVESIFLVIFADAIFAIVFVELDF